MDKIIAAPDFREALYNQLLNILANGKHHVCRKTQIRPTITEIILVLLENIAFKAKINNTVISYRPSDKHSLIRIQ